MESPADKQREKVVMIYKREGDTPLQALDRFRKEYPLYNDAVLSYAGRLDPMAEGLLLVLVDNENLFRRHYLNFDKKYEVDVLLGISTDTGDALGKITMYDDHIIKKRIDEGIIKNVLKEFEGEIVLDYPAFSSKTVEGKALFELAKEGKLNPEDMPQKRSRIFSIKYLGDYSFTPEKLINEVRNRILRVTGDFRQDEIMEIWLKTIRGIKMEIDTRFPVFRISVECTSGTYMRSLAESMAIRLRTVGIAYRIKRLRVGDYEVVLKE
jgi:tRNA pseudouridine(55) synthase